jgi:hypothetical protein
MALVMFPLLWAERKGFRRTDVIPLQPLAHKAEINVAINDSQQVILRDLFFRGS